MFNKIDRKVIVSLNEWMKTMHFKIVLLWGYSSKSGLFRFPEWWEENPTSGQGSSTERSPVGSRLSELLFLDVPGTATEQLRTCGFRRNSSSFDRAPKIRDSVLLNSFESFLVNLPSISSETWEMYSWAISGSSVFWEWLFLVFSGVTLETAASFLLFLKVAMILREKFCQWWRLNWRFLFCNPNWLSPLIMREKSLNKYKQSMILKGTTSEGYNIYIITVLSFLLFIPFFRGKDKCLHAKSRYK